MTKSLRKNIVREIRGTWKRFLSIAMMALLGAGFFAGINAASVDMQLSCDRYLDEQNCFDLEVLSTLGLTDDDVEAVRDVKGIEDAVGIYSENVLVNIGEGDEKVKLLSIPADSTINALHLVDGEMAHRAMECVVPQSLLDITGKQIGDVLHITETLGDEEESSFRHTSLTITGVIESPLYLYGSSGNNERSTGAVADYMYVPQCNITEDYFTELYLTVKGAAALDSFDDAYETKVEAAELRVKQIADAREQARYDQLTGDANAEIDDAQAELDEKTAEGQQKLDDAQADIDDAQRKIADGRTQLAQSRQDAKREFASAQAKIDSGESQLAQARRLYNQQSGAAKKQRAALVSKRKEVQTQITELQDKQPELEQTISDLQEKREPLKQTVAQLEEQRAPLAAAVEQYQSNIDQLTAALQQAQEKRDALLAGEEQNNTDTAEQDTQAQGEGETQTTENTAANQEEIAALDAQIAQLQQQIDALEAECAPYKTQLEQLDAGLNEAKDGLAQIDDGIAQAEDGLAQIKEGISQAKDGIAQIDDGIAQIDDGLASGKAKISAAAQQLARAKSQLASAKSSAYAQMADAQRELDEGEAELEDGIAELAVQRADFNEQIADAQAEIDDARAEVGDINKPTWYVLSRDGNTGLSSFAQDSNNLKRIGFTFPLIFFLVAVLISLSSMTRMVEEHRGQIGTLKALGYSGGQIAAKYLIYAATASVLGSVVGELICFQLLPKIVWQIYMVFYTLPAFYTPIDPFYGVIGLLVCSGCIVAATGMACMQELRHTPAQLMRPKAPVAGKRVLLERIPPLWRRFNFSQKVTLRNLFRYKKRFFMTICGIAGCSALITTGFGLRDSIALLLPLQYQDVMHYDLLAVADTDLSADEFDALSDDMMSDHDVNSCLRIYAESVKVVTPEGKSTEMELFVPSDADAFPQYISLLDTDTGEARTLSDDTVFLTEQIAEQLGVTTGDTVTLRRENGTKADIEVGAVVHNYLSHYAFLSSDGFRSAYGETAQDNALVLNTNELTDAQSDAFTTKWNGDDRLSAVSSTRAARSAVDDRLGLLNQVVVILVTAAAALAVVVLYNLSNINISERIRELATIKVLGFYDGEVYQYNTRETIILTILGTIMGLFGGRWLTSFILHTMEMQGIVIVPTVAAVSYAYAAALTIVFASAVNIMTYFSLKKINMVEALKSVE